VLSTPPQLWLLPASPERYLDTVALQPGRRAPPGVRASIAIEPESTERRLVVQDGTDIGGSCVLHFGRIWFLAIGADQLSRLCQRQNRLVVRSKLCRSAATLTWTFDLHSAMVSLRRKALKRLRRAHR
jgi:hypothetical protein